jgi:hypothetical protein
MPVHLAPHVYVIGFVVAKRYDLSFEAQANRIAQGSPSFNSHKGAGNKAHFAQTVAQAALDLHSGNGGAFSFMQGA